MYVTAVPRRFFYFFLCSPWGLLDTGDDGTRVLLLHRNIGVWWFLHCSRVSNLVLPPSCTSTKAARAAERRKKGPRDAVAVVTTTGRRPPPRSDHRLGRRGAGGARTARAVYTVTAPPQPPPTVRTAATLVSSTHAWRTGGRTFLAVVLYCRRS